LLDITDLKQAEHALREKDEQLRHSQKMEAIGQLAGGLAHDFNNVLSVILNYAELLMQDIHEGDPRLDDLQAIREAGQRAASLIEQLLVFSRKKGGTPRIANVNEIVFDLKKLLKRTIREDVFLSAQLAPDVDLVKIDPAHIEQILVNLVVNAKDAMPSGGEIVIESSPVNVDESLAARHPGLRQGKCVRLTVRDTGCGMSEEVKARVFEPFFTTKPVGKGTGLGLAMVYALVQEARGNVEIESTQGEGTTVNVYLPATAGAVVGRKDTPGTAEQGGGELILVVEDEPSVRRVVKRILEGNGYTVISASSGKEALEVVQDESVDLVLTDMVMPGMSGKELVADLMLVLPHARYCYMSGYAQELMASNNEEEQVPLLRKPFSTHELLSRVRALLDGSTKRSNDKAVTQA
jgi:two-component system cell cycle sensor histidine kinase/response regulator CckA